MPPRKRKSTTTSASPPWSVPSVASIEADIATQKRKFQAAEERHKQQLSVLNNLLFEARRQENQKKEAEQECISRLIEDDVYTVCRLLDASSFSFSSSSSSSSATASASSVLADAQKKTDWRTISEPYKRLAQSDSYRRAYHAPRYIQNLCAYFNHCDLLLELLPTGAVSTITGQRICCHTCDIAHAMGHRSFLDAAKNASGHCSTWAEKKECSFGFARDLSRLQSIKDLLGYGRPQEWVGQWDKMELRYHAYALARSPPPHNNATPTSTASTAVAVTQATTLL